MFVFINLANVAAWGFFELRIKKREAGMLARKLIGIMDSVVTILAEGSFICSAEYSCCFFPTNITLNLHCGSFCKSSLRTRYL